MLTSDAYRLLVESVQDYAIYMLDPEGRVTTWSSGAEKIKGYTRDEILGRHFSAFFTSEDRAAGRPAHELSIAERAGRFEEEAWRVRKDGSRFWASVVVSPLRDGEELVGFAKVTRDLTTRRQAEETARELLREQIARKVAEDAQARIAEEGERYRSLSRRLEVILEAVADAITVQDRSGSLLFANTAAAKMCGASSVAELLRAPIDEIVSRFQVLDERGAAVPADELPGHRVLAGAESASALVRVLDRASGRERWRAIRARGVVDEDGRPELAVNIWHDVTVERRREEHERYLARASAALSSSLESGSMLSTFAELLVPELAEWCSIHLLEGERVEEVAVAHADAEPAPPRLRRIWNVLRSGRPELYEERTDDVLADGGPDAASVRPTRELEIRSFAIVPIRIRDRVHGALSLSFAGSSRRYDEHDVALFEELGRRAGVAIDNARLFAAEKYARAQLELLARAGAAFSSALDYEETLRDVVDICLPALGDFAFFDVVERGGVRRLAAVHDDPRTQSLLEGVRADRLGLTMRALSTGETAFHPSIDDAWRQRAASGPEELELLRRLSLGSLVTVPLRARGEVLGSLTVGFGKSGRQHTLDDLSLVEELARRAGVAVLQSRLYEETQAAAKRAEAAALRAEEASRIKDEFLATLSHELRTPLNAIVGWSSLLRGRTSDPSLAKGIEVIHRNAEAQSKLIEDILDVSRVIMGKLRLEIAPADLVSVVQDAIEVVRPSATAKGIPIHFTPPPEPCLLVADSDRLRQVAWNLLSNAVKFTDAGGAVTVSLRREGSSLAFAVSDTGRGIEPEFLPYVFERFKQADGSTTRRVGGLGLGLAIVRHIVELHGGKVGVRSSGVGSGATFTVVLPVRAVQPVAPERERPSRDVLDGGSQPRTESLRGLRVLVVDDENDARELLATVIVTAGADVETASTASEGFARLQEFRPHVLVSDIGMPDEDGYSLMRRVRALDPAHGGATPSIALTAYTRGEDRTRALAVGFTTHIGKPVNPDDLLAAVGNLAKLSPIAALSSGPSRGSTEAG